jgi:hypothetical protein
MLPYQIQPKIGTVTVDLSFQYLVAFFLFDNKHSQSGGLPIDIIVHLFCIQMVLAHGHWR